MHGRISDGARAVTSKMHGALNTLTAYQAISSAFRRRFARDSPETDIVDVTVHADERVIQVVTYPNPSDATMEMVDALRDRVDGPWVVSHIDYLPAESR
jgi:hypothetical protein